MYVKDIFNENGLKPITDIGRILLNKQNWLCEYRILHKIFSNGIIKKFNCDVVNFINIRDQRNFLFLNVYDSVIEKKCKFF